MKPKLAASLVLAFLLILGAFGNMALGQLAGWGVSRKPGNVSEYFQESFKYEAEQNYNSALKSIVEILKTDPRDYTANLRGGWLSYLNGSYEDSITYYRRALTVAPNAIEPRLGLTLPLMALKRWKETDSEAMAVLKVDPKNYYATSRLAFSLFSQKRYAEAERYYRALLDLYPSDLEMRLGLGWTFFYTGRKPNAQLAFTEVLKVSPQNASALAGLEALGVK